ncbi:MAG: FAD-dependent oxidoreductase, partial [archaeon]
VGTASSASFARKLGLELTGNSIKTDEKGETSMEAVYAAGEATGQNKQVAICVGEGCKAAINVIKYLRKKDAYVDYS